MYVWTKYIFEKDVNKEEYNKIIFVTRYYITKKKWYLLRHLCLTQYKIVYNYL